MVVTNTRINNTKKKNTRSKGTRKNVNNKKFKKANCAPSSEKKDFTCYSDNALIKMKNLWNSRHPDHKINTNSTYDIWIQLKTMPRLAWIMFL